MQHTVDIIDYLKAKGINFIMRAIGKFKYEDDLIYKTNTDLKPKAIRRMFRKRFAIETSYRMINQFLPKTMSKLYSLRKLYFYLEVLLYNIWVFINYKSEKVTVQ